jgi:hypothetical protein
MVTPTERLPSLHDKPPARAADAARKKPAGSMWPWYLLLFLLVMAVGAGAWWLSTGKEVAAPQLPAEESLPIPVTQAEPAGPGTDEAIGNDVVPATATPQASPVRANPRVVTSRTQRPADLPANPATPEGETGSAGRSVFPADEPASGLPTTEPNPVVAYNPRPYGGRVVQLGAFPTRAQAEENWKRITRRYPYLATKPKMVNTVDVRALGGGRPTRMYRLQLGTSSQAQSVVICQQLERAGHSCVVVY